MCRFLSWNQSIIENTSLIFNSRKQNQIFNVVSYLRGRLLHANYHEAPTELKWYITTAVRKISENFHVVDKHYMGHMTFFSIFLPYGAKRSERISELLGLLLAPFPKSLSFSFLFYSCLLLTIRHVSAISCCENI